MKGRDRVNEKQNQRDLLVLTYTNTKECDPIIKDLSCKKDRKEFRIQYRNTALDI